MVSGVKIILSTTLMEEKFPMVLSKNSKTISQSAVFIIIGFTLTKRNPSWIATTAIINKFTMIAVASIISTCDSSFKCPPQTMSAGKILSITRA